MTEEDLKMFDDLIKKKKKYNLPSSEVFTFAKNGSKITVKDARRAVRAAFDIDDGFVDGYVANVAMLLHDRYGIRNYEKRNKAAEEILQLIFYSSEKNKGDPTWRKFK